MNENPENNIEAVSKEAQIIRLKERLAEMMPVMLEQYKTLHENPELGGEEFETAKFIKDALEKMGVKILAEGLGGAGIIAEIEGNKEGPTVALRADIDALQMSENPNHEVKSKVPGKMHACGHDMHTVGLLGAAQVLKEMADGGKLDGNVVLIFQSNEEKAVDKKSGSIPVIKYLEESGIRDRIQAFFALHVLALLERGTVVLTNRLQWAGSSFVEVKMKTIGGHGSQVKVLPDIDYMLSDIKTKVSDTMVEYWEKDEAVVDSMAPKTTYEADNIILSSGGRSWAIRILSEDYKKISSDIQDKIKKIIQESVSSHIKKTIERAEKKGEKRKPSDYDVDLDISIRPNTRPTIHRDINMVNIVGDSASETLDNFKRVDMKSLATDDFSYFLEEFRGLEIPGVYMAIGGANSEKGFPNTPQHSPNFAVDPNSMADLASVHVETVKNALDYFNFKNKTV